MSSSLGTNTIPHSDLIRGDLLFFRIFPNFFLETPSICCGNKEKNIVRKCAPNFPPKNHVFRGKNAQKWGWKKIFRNFLRAHAPLCHGPSIWPKKKKKIEKKFSTRRFWNFLIFFRIFLKFAIAPKQRPGSKKFRK